MISPICFNNYLHTLLDGCICSYVINMGIINCDTPPSSLMDSIANPKVKTTKGEGLGARSLAHSTSGVEGRARASRWD
jgi:hypothetical protein